MIKYTFWSYVLKKRDPLSCQVLEGLSCSLCKYHPFEVFRDLIHLNACHQLFLISCWNKKKWVYINKTSKKSTTIFENIILSIFFQIRLDIPLRPQRVHSLKQKKRPAHCYNCSKRGHYGFVSSKWLESFCVILTFIISSLHLDLNFTCLHCLCVAQYLIPHTFSLTLSCPSCLFHIQLINGLFTSFLFPLLVQTSGWASNYNSIKSRQEMCVKI